MFVKFLYFAYFYVEIHTKNSEFIHIFYILVEKTSLPELFFFQPHTNKIKFNNRL